jgi:hypothetical protein
MKKPTKPPEVIDATVHTEVDQPPKLVAFLYLLLDEMPATKAVRLISQASRGGFGTFGDVQDFARQLAKKLMAE